MKIYVLLLIYIIIKYVCVCLCACVYTHVHEVLQGGGNHVGIFLYEIDIKLTILKTTSIFIQQIFIDYVLHVQQCGNDYLAVIKATYAFNEIQIAKFEVENWMLLFTVQKDLCFAKQFF